MPKIIVIGKMQDYAGDHEAFDTIRKVAARVLQEIRDEQSLEQKESTAS